MTTPTSLTVRFDLPETKLPIPEAVNFFHFIVSGPEVEMLVGYLDLQQIHEASQKVKPGQTTTLTPEITHRFALSARGLTILKRQVEEISQKYEELAAAERGNG